MSAQTTSFTAIRFFVGLSVAFEIASVLAAVVVQKPREIGILRAMGISRGQILRVFLLQGGLPATGGAVLGSGEQTTLLDDRALTRLRGQSIGFAFRYRHLITAFTAVENVMMSVLGAERLANDAMRVRAAALIASVGLTVWQKNLAGKLSGGQQQRVAIARGLAMGPALLLADEPTGNRDTRIADEVFALLRQFNAEHGTTVLFVAHNVEFAQRCDRIIEVVDGRLTGSAETGFKP